MKTISKELNYNSRIVAKFGLHTIGNQKPYFSITGEIYENNKLNICGCIHEEILKSFPDLGSIVDIHLSDVDGIPMHSVENGWFHAGGYGFENTNVEYLASHLRISLDDAKNIIEEVETCYMTKEKFIVFVYKQLPRWKDEANQAIELMKKFN